MSLTLNQLTKQAMKLPAASRAQLAEQLVQSLENADGGVVREAWTTEAIRRRDEVRSGKVRPVSGKEVHAQVRRVVGR